MIIYKNTFENIKTIGSNFPLEDQYYAEGNTAIVADGITRDPIGISDLSSCSFEEMIEKYPRPSGAELAAREIVKSFSTAEGSLKEKLIECNKSVKKLNNKHIKECDYLQNDYYGAVASCVKVMDDTLHYAYICDCGVIVYDKLGNIKFQTEDDKKKYCNSHMYKIGIPWHLPESRVIVRRDYRNNLNNIEDGKCVSYGALTGEEAAVYFIRKGKVELSQGDIVVVYSDGFDNFLHEKEFIRHMLNFNKKSFEEYVENMSNSDYNKFGKEKTLVIIK